MISPNSSIQIQSITLAVPLQITINNDCQFIHILTDILLWSNDSLFHLKQIILASALSEIILVHFDFIFLSDPAWFYLNLKS